MSKKETVRSMFNDISGKYDFLNHFLSLGTDYGWRRKFVRILGKNNPSEVLDVATGTGDLAIAISLSGNIKVTGIDISEQMLAVGQKKVSAKKLDDRITLLPGDAENIPFPDGSFDAVTVAFGVRNFEDLEKGLSEMKRVLRDGGTMQILEFSRPSPAFFRFLYKVYSATVIPLAGKIISGNSRAYSYLPESVAAFPSGKDFLVIMERTGMKELRQYRLTFGIATIYIGKK